MDLRPAIEEAIVEGLIGSAGIASRIDVAAELFARNGLDGVGVRQIAETAGILAGSLYHHISSKRDLYVEMHGAALARGRKLA